MLGIRTILCPTDFSERSRYALDLAAALARDYGARLIVLYVVEPMPAGEFGIPWTPELEAAEKRRLEEWKPKHAGVAIEYRMVEGLAAEQILRLAQETPCDLIVMGTHGRTGVDRLLTGSVTEAVLRRASCPVLAVRVPLAAKPATPQPGGAVADQPILV